MTTRTLLTPASITVTAGGSDLDVSGLQGPVCVTVTARNTAGTNPTLATKLQSSTGLARGYDKTTAGATDSELREGATTNVKMAATFTQSGARSIKKVALMLKKGGTITAGKKLTLTIETNNAGAPSGTPVANGTSATVDIDTEVSTSYALVTFTFASPVDVADATIYHFVLAGDYTASADNNVLWRSATVASGGNMQKFDNTNWAATATQDFEICAEQYTFADITSGGFTTLSTALNTTVQTLEFYAGNIPQFMRLHSTVGGTGSPAFAAAATVTAARVQEQ